jgi:SAM-dependent methyltransferase
MTQVPLETSGLKTRLWQALYEVRGFVTGHEPLLQQKQSYHAKRRTLERSFLKKARVGFELQYRTCPVCHRLDIEYTFTNEVGFRFQVCKTDGTMFMNPVPSEESLGELYNSDAETFDHVRTEAQSVPVPTATDIDDRKALLRMAPDKRRGALLDVGCSLGRFLMAARADFDVSGVELNRQTAELARAAGLDVFAGRLEELPGNKKYDVITMLQVIEHIVDVKGILKSAHEKLNPGGILYLNTPAADSASLGYLRERHVHVASFAHVSLLTPDGLAQLGNEVGLSLVAREYCGGLDVSLDDMLTHALVPQRFVHRMASYSARVYFAARLLNRTPLKRAVDRLSPRGHESYFRAVLQKPTDVPASKRARKTA